MTASPVTGLHHVAMRVADFDRSAAFYEALGLERVLAWGERTSERDGRAVMLACPDGARLELFAGGASGAKPEGAWIHIALATGDCDAAWARALAAGAQPHSEKPYEVVIPADAPTPVKIAFCQGPDGETLEFFETL